MLRDSRYHDVSSSYSALTQHGTGANLRGGVVRLIIIGIAEL